MLRWLNVRIALLPIGQFYCRLIIQSANCPDGKISYRLNVLLAKCIFRQTILSTKCLFWINVPFLITKFTSRLNGLSTTRNEFCEGVYLFIFIKSYFKTNCVFFKINFGQDLLILLNIYI